MENKIYKGKTTEKKIGCLSLTIFLVLFSISLVSSITIYSGESITFELEKPYEYYSIVGNSTEVILEISQVGNNVTIIPDKYSLNDSYEIIFFDSEKETITVYSGGGGGGYRTKWKTEYKNVTEYVDKEFIKEIEVPGGNIEVEKVTNKIPWWVWVFVIFLIIIISFLVLKKQDKVERGYEKYE